MVMQTLKFSVLQIVLFLACTFAQNSLAQELKTYRGAYQIGDYTGIANFEYHIKNMDTIFDGKFSFGNVIENDIKANTKPVIVSGSFKNNQPDGKWKFQLGNFSNSGKKTMVNYQYVNEINGVQKSIIVNLKEGEPSGKWLIQIDSLKNSEAIKTLFKSDFDYSNGIPQKTFRIENHTEYMVGRLLKNAVAHDVWSLYTKEGVGELENWYFNEGKLEKLTIKDKEQTKQIKLDYGNANTTATISLDEHYIDIMELRLQRQDTTHVFDHGMSTLLKKDSKNYELVVAFFNDLGTPLVVQGFRVIVPEFTLTPSQISTLAAIENNYKQSDTLIHDILSDSQLNILKLSDADTKFLYEVSSKINNAYLKPMGKLLTYKNEDVIQHIEPKDLVKGLWPDGFPGEMITVIDSLGNEKPYSLDKSYFTTLKDDFSGVLELSNFTVIVSQKLQSQLEQKLSTNKRETAFLVQEKQMIAQSTSLKTHIDSLNNNLPAVIEKTLLSLNTFANLQLASYSKMKEDTNKLQQSQKLTACFKNAKFLANAIINLPAQETVIEEAYKDQVWNPFTATLMDEDIKKRITKAYKKQVVPFYLNEIAQNLSCETITETTTNLQELHDRMLALKDEDTKKLERKLKRADDPMEVLQLFRL